jgi:hypothetical protein
VPAAAVTLERRRHKRETIGVVNVRERSVLSAVFGLWLGAIALAAVATPMAQAGTFVDDVLRRQMRFSAADLRALDAGAAVVKTLETPSRQEVAHWGVVHIQAATEHFIERFRDIERFESGPGIPRIGRFGVVPRLDDLASLTLPAEDVEALQRCRPGNCDVKLSAAAMRRFRAEVNWSSPNAARQADAVFREMLLDLVRAYQTNGNEALGHYDDGDETLPVAEVFRALLAGSDLLPARVPALIAYLEAYPRGRPTGAEDFFYWSVVDFGLKPTMRVSHVTIHPLADSPSSDVAYAIAIKQLYASHYFHSTLELRFLVDDRRSSARRGFYLVSITRSRNDGMTGFAGSLLRSIISRRSRAGVRRYLEHVKQQVERAAPTAQLRDAPSGTTR